MTVVVGVEDLDGTVYLAHDGRALMDDCELFYQAAIPKVVAVGPWAVGCAGSPHTGQLLRASHAEIVQDLAPGETDPVAFFRFGQRVRQLLRDEGYRPREKSFGGEDFSRDFLLGGASSGLWYLDVECAAHRIAPGLAMALGSGGAAALGALRVLERHRLALGLSVVAMLLEALQAAAAGDVTCGPPFTVGRLTREGFEVLDPEMEIEERKATERQPLAAAGGRR